MQSVVWLNPRELKLCEVGGSHKNPNHIIKHIIRSCTPQPFSKTQSLLSRPRVFSFFIVPPRDCCYFLQTKSFPALLRGSEDVTELRLSRWYKSTFCPALSVKDHVHPHEACGCTCAALPTAHVETFYSVSIVFLPVVLTQVSSLALGLQYTGPTGRLITFSLLAAGNDGRICILN